MRIRVVPPIASLEDVWDGHAHLEIDGPAGIDCTVTATLGGIAGTLSTRASTATLPVGAEGWRSHWSAHRNHDSLAEAYDDSEFLRFEVQHTSLGEAAVQLDREITTLRWSFQRTRSEVRLELRESGDLGGETETSFFSFETPLVRRGLPLDDGSCVARWGGMYLAQVREQTAGALVAATATSLTDLVPSPPNIEPPRPDLAGVKRFVSILGEWAAARSSGDVLVEMSRSQVLRWGVSRLMTTLAGDRWGGVERRYLENRRIDPRLLFESVTPSQQWRSFRQQVRALASKSHHDPPSTSFGTALGGPASSRQRPGVLSSARPPGASGPAAQFAFGGEPLAEFLLRLASDPWTVPWDDPAAAVAFQDLVRNPVVLRAARALYISASLGGSTWKWD